MRFLNGASPPPSLVKNERSLVSVCVIRISRKHFTEVFQGKGRVFNYLCLSELARPCPTI